MKDERAVKNNLLDAGCREQTADFVEQLFLKYYKGNFYVYNDGVYKEGLYEIERCIVNLVSNAAKFTPEGGTIEVCIKDLDEKVMITVEDSGIGIDKKYHKSIFNRFDQVIDNNAEYKGGSGLGLTITKQIIDMHNGEIHVESELGKGCKFIIIL